MEPTVQTVLFDIYTEASSLVNDYKVGAIDAALDLDPGFYAPLKSVSGSQLTDSPALGFHEMGMNCYQSAKSKGNPLLLDVKVRQAICYAIDKDTIAKTAMDGLAPVASSLLSPVQSEFRWVVPQDQLYAFDPAKAKQILDAAGYKMGSGGVRVAPNGKPLSLRLNAITDYPMDVSAAKMIAGYLKDVGIGIKLDITDEGAFTDLNYDNANDDLYLWNWNADIDPGYILSTFTTGQLLNGSDSEYSNPQYDKLYVQQAEATDPAQRKAIIEQMQQILYRDAPYAILWYNVQHPGLPHRPVDRLRLGAAGRRRRGAAQHDAHHVHQPEARDRIGRRGRRREQRADRRDRDRRAGRRRHRDRAGRPRAKEGCRGRLDPERGAPPGRRPSPVSGARCWASPAPRARPASAWP